MYKQQRQQRSQKKSKCRPGFLFSEVKRGRGGIARASGGETKTKQKSAIGEKMNFKFKITACVSFDDDVVVVVDVVGFAYGPILHTK